MLTAIDNSRPNYRWYVLSLAMLISVFAPAAAVSSMPVLFAEISGELGLTLVEVGVVWGSIAMAGIIVLLFAGLLGDRFGAKRMVTIACFLAALFGASRGLSNGFISLVVTSFLFGSVGEMIQVNTTKIVSQWFWDKRAGLAQGVLTTGIGIGCMVGTMLSATVLSPLLGGWRNVLFFYGAVSLIIGVVWVVTVRQPDYRDSIPVVATPELRQSLSHVVRNRTVWLLAITMMGFLGCYQSVTGYLPLYLRSSGWAPASADGALTALNTASVLFAVPVLLLSDRLGKRKVFFIIGLASAIVCTGLLSIVTGLPIWLLAVVLGALRDACIALAAVLTIGAKGIGSQYAGTAIGFVLLFSRVGMAVSPPLGNSLAVISPGMPFVLWSGLAVMSLVVLLFVTEAEKKKIQD